MHDRGDHESNVVHLRRRGEPADAEREWLASTIFAEEDDVGPFSRGNLVPPRRAPDAEPTSPPTEPDPFFDGLTRTDTSDRSPAGAEDAVDDTDAYFDRIRAQTPVEMAESESPAAPGHSLPGSARLPAEPRPRHRLRRHAAWILRTGGGPREARSSSGESGTGAKIRGPRLAAAGRKMRPLGATALCLVLLGSRRRDRLERGLLAEHRAPARLPLPARVEPFWASRLIPSRATAPARPVPARGG